MAQPRSALVSLETTPYYHVISNCVRQSYLCGKDKSTGKSFDHRRSWIENRLNFLASVFAIDICAYSIMHTHYHATLHINADKAHAFSDKEVVRRWHKLYKGTDLTRKFLENDELTEAELATVHKLCKKWRVRLFDLSWFMRCCNEHIARRANQEDDCKGHFWQGRFKSIPILDYKALMNTMIYNDLNPLKAGIATDFNNATYTSIKRRLISYRVNKKNPKGLAAFSDTRGKHEPQVHTLPFLFSDYLETIEWTARKYKSTDAVLPETPVPQIIKFLSIEPHQWEDSVVKFESNFISVVGTSKNIKTLCRRLNQRWMQGLRNCERCFTSTGQENNPLMSMMLAKPPKTQI